MRYGGITQAEGFASNLKQPAAQPKGPMTIPAEIRRRLGLEKSVLNSRREIVATKALRQLGAMLKEKGITLADLMESGRRIRGELVKELYGLEEASDAQKS
ncbi:MAG: hypothetical protein MN733_10700 [Nitrososphaera sp.]|nr:hypothetical protein [Nitrososphaera sp.]